MGFRPVNDLSFDKRMTVDDIVGQIKDGMTIGMGGWASRRKPMALARAIARSNLKDLTLVAPYGGPEIGLLAASGKLKKLVFAFASLDHIPIEPHFKNARQAGLPVWELDEGMAHWMLRCAAMKLPFLPTRVGIGTSILDQPGFATVKSPFEDGEELVAVPPLKLDVALIHVHRSDEKGNILVLSPDPFFDELIARAATSVYATAEKIVSTADLDMYKNARFNLFERSVLTGVAEAPFGAHPTSAQPDYEIDMKHLKTYVASAETPEAWEAYRQQFVAVDADAYLAAVGGADAVLASPRPVY